MKVDWALIHPIAVALYKEGKDDTNNYGFRVACLAASSALNKLLPYL